MSTVPPDRLGVARETSARFLICNSLTEWAKCALSALDQEPAAHHNALIRELQEISTGVNTRLIVLMPPGSAKSTYASVLFPAWWFTQHPRSSIIGVSHTASLGEHFGRQARNLIVDNRPRLGYGLYKTDIMSYSRPSDEEILKYEQSIMDSEVNNVPLVSAMVPIASLAEEYCNNILFLQQISVPYSPNCRPYHRNTDMFGCVVAMAIAFTERLHLDSYHNWVNLQSRTFRVL